MKNIEIKVKKKLEQLFTVRQYLFLFLPSEKLLKPTQARSDIQ